MVEHNNQAPIARPGIAWRASCPGVVFSALHGKHVNYFAEKVMGEAEWEQHRKATYRHWLEPRRLVQKVLGFLPILVLVSLLSVAVGVYNVTLVKWYNWPTVRLECVQTVFSSITFALTLLLVFKTNSSYARWADARRSLGMLTSTAHDLGRQTVASFQGHQVALMCAMLRWTAASMWVVKSMVRPGSPLRQELTGVLQPAELEWLLAQRHKPLALGQALSSILHAADLDGFAKLRLDKAISTFTYEFGACNRIYNTAIPSAFTRHLSRFLITYIVVGLPLLLWPLAGWLSPFLAVLVAFLLLGIENIAAFVEEPFHIMAFDAFCAAVQRDVQTLLAMASNSTPVVAGLSCPDRRDLPPPCQAAPDNINTSSKSQGPEGLSPSWMMQQQPRRLRTIPIRSCSASDITRSSRCNSSCCATEDALSTPQSSDSAV